jgi:hypothetical protein
MNKEEKGRIFIRLKAELENLDPDSSSRQQYTSNREGGVCGQHRRRKRGGRGTGAGILRYMARAKERPARTHHDRMLDIQKESSSRYVYFT